MQKKSSGGIPAAQLQSVFGTASPFVKEKGMELKFQNLYQNQDSFLSPET